MLEQLRQPERAPARRRVPAPLRHFAAMTDYCRVSSGGPEHHWAQEVQRRDPASVARAAAAKRQLWRSVPSGQRFKKRVSQRDASDVKGIREKVCHLPQKIEFNDRPHSQHCPAVLFIYFGPMHSNSPKSYGTLRFLGAPWCLEIPQFKEVIRNGIVLPPQCDAQVALTGEGEGGVPGMVPRGLDMQAWRKLIG